MDRVIKTMVTERLDKIEFEFVHMDKNCHSVELKIKDSLNELRKMASTDVVDLVDKIISLESDRQIKIKDEIYKKAFKDGLTFREYL